MNILEVFIDIGEKSTQFTDCVWNNMQKAAEDEKEFIYVLAVAAMASAIDTISKMYGKDPNDARKAVLEVGPKVDKAMEEQGWFS